LVGYQDSERRFEYPIHTHPTRVWASGSSIPEAGFNQPGSDLGVAEEEFTRLDQEQGMRFLGNNV
jgi:hypothetical protein